jgi:inositol-hexakisphosphate kinase
VECRLIHIFFYLIRKTNIYLFQQVYQIDSGSYIFTDKYRGRVLTVDGFRSALVEFFNNGHALRLDVLPGILERLESLYITISSLLKYRFYSGSLLIVYDGSPQSNLIDIRMIDFAHTIRGSTTPNDESSASLTNHIGPDKNYLYGLERLIEVFREILNDKKPVEDDKEKDA